MRRLRVKLIEWLFRRGHPRAFAALVRLRARDPFRSALHADEPWLREDAACGLARIGDPRDMAAIGDLLDDPYAQDVAQLCLQDYGAAAVPVLLHKLATSDAASLCALEGLGAVGDERVLEPVARVALEAPDEFDRQWACEALKALADRHSDLRPRVLTALERVAAGDGDQSVRDLAAWLLGGGRPPA